MRKIKQMSKQLTAVALASLMATTPVITYANDQKLPGWGTTELILF